MKDGLMKQIIPIFFSTDDKYAPFVALAPARLIAFGLEITRQDVTLRSVFESGKESRL